MAPGKGKNKLKVKPSDLPPLNPTSSGTSSEPATQAALGSPGSQNAAPTPPKPRCPGPGTRSKRLGVNEKSSTVAAEALKGGMRIGLEQELACSTQAEEATTSQAVATVAASKKSNLVQARAVEMGVPVLPVPSSSFEDEIQSLKAEVFSAQAAKGELEKKVEDLEIQNAHLQTKLADGHTEVGALQAQLATTLAISDEREKVILEAELDRLLESRGEVHRLEKEGAALQQALIVSQTQLDAITADSRQKLESLEKANSDLRSELASQAAQVQTNSKVHSREIEDLGREKALLQTAFDVSRQKYKDKVDMLQGEIARLKTSLARANQTKVEQSAAIARLNASMAEPIKQIDESGKVRAELANSRDEIDKLKKELANKVEEIEDLECACAALQADLDLTQGAKYVSTLGLREIPGIKSPTPPRPVVAEVPKRSLHSIYVRWVTPGKALDSPRLCEITPDTTPLPSTTTITELKTLALSRADLRRGYEVTAPYELVANINNISTTDPNSATLAALERGSNLPVDLFVAYHSTTPKARSGYSSWGFSVSQRGIANFRTALRVLLEQVRTKGCLNSMLEVIWEMTHFPPAVTAFKQLYVKGDDWNIPCAIAASCFREIIQRTVPSWTLEASRQIFAQVWLRILVHHGESPRQQGLPIVRSVSMTPVHGDYSGRSKNENIVTIRVGEATQKVRVTRLEDKEDGVPLGTLALLMWGQYDETADHYFCKHSYLADTRPLFLYKRSAESLLTAANQVDAFRIECPTQLRATHPPCLTLNKSGYLSIYSVQSTGQAISPKTWNAISGEELLLSNNADQLLLAQLQPIIARRKKDGTWKLDAWLPTPDELRATEAERLQDNQRQEEEQRKKKDRRQKVENEYEKQRLKSIIKERQEAEEQRRREEQRLKEVQRRIEKRQAEERRKEEERIREEQRKEMQRKEEERKEEQRKEEQRKEEQRKEVQAKLKQMGRNCPVGFAWHREGNGWRCGGKAHFVSDSEVNAYELNTDASKETVGFFGWGHNKLG
ncbi:MAG: hypothetical protein M1839_003310 [Geoglossum umbratile]|nr:MAG: hypothetical protein M1839_003310 [Geoglossum umbratile]